MKVLFAVDLTEPVRAIRQVEELCDRLDAELFVLHVDAPLDPSANVLDPSGFDTSLHDYGLFDPELATEIEENQESAFESFLKRRFSKPVKAHLRESGDPAAIIIQEIEQLGIHLLALGHKNHALLRRLLSGSVSKEVIRLSRIPVILIPIEGNDGQGNHASEG